MKKYILNFEVPRTLHNKIKARAKREDLSMAQWIRRALLEAVGK